MHIHDSVIAVLHPEFVVFQGHTLHQPSCLHCNAIILPENAAQDCTHSELFSGKSQAQSAVMAKYLFGDVVDGVKAKAGGGLH